MLSAPLVRTPTAVCTQTLREPTAGLAAARARGRKGGRPKGVNRKRQKAALALKRDPRYSVREICEIVGISRNPYYKYTREEGSQPEER